MTATATAQPTSIAAIRTQLGRLDLAIRRRELLLELIRTVQGEHLYKSDRGWMISMFTLEAGTLKAVLSGAKARNWGRVAQSLEGQLVSLKVDQKLKQAELKAALNA